MPRFTFFMFFCCFSLNIAQHEAQSQANSCPDSCLLQEVMVTMKEKIEIMETTLRDSEIKLINTQSQLEELKNQGTFNL